MSEVDKETKKRQSRLFPDMHKYSLRELQHEFGIRLPRRTEYQRMFTLEEAEEIVASLPPREKRTPKSKNPCDGCSLQGHKKVLSAGDLSTAKVVFVGEAPGQEEEEQSEPFVGRAGQLLRKTLTDVGFNLKDCYFANTLRCRPPGNRTPADYEVKRCERYLRNELISFSGLIVCLGAVATRALTGRIGIHNNRGYGFFKDNKKLFVTYHPAFILRDREEHNYGALFKKDLRKAAAFVDFPPKIRYNIIRDDKTLDSFISTIKTFSRTAQEMTGQDFEMSVDIETNTYDEAASDAKILTIAFSYGVKKDKNWMLPISHFESPFKERAGEVMQKIAWMFSNKNIKLIGQGGKFDIKFLNALYGIEVLNYFFDTQIAHFLLEGKSHIHKLKSLAWRYTKYGGYDLDRTSLAEVPLKELGDYNMLDAFVTRKLKRIFWKQLSEKQRDLMTETICPSEGALAEIENVGMLVDEETRQFMESKYVKELSEIETRMHSYPEIVKMEAERGAIVNFNSGDQLRELFKRIGVHPTRKTKKRRDVSTDKKAIEEVKSKHPVLQDLLGFRTKEKILSTYLLKYKNLGKRVRGDYSSITTATGRLACSKPNLQNIPYAVRPVFVSGLGYLVEADYSQLELRVLAMYSKDEVLISNFLKGFDIHENTRFKIFGDNSNLSKLKQTKQRVAAKTVNFGIAYGVTPVGLCENLAEAGVVVSRKRAGEMIDIFYDLYPRVSKWQDEVWNQVKAQGYYETFFGRTRKFNLSRATNETQLAKLRREAINTPIQGTASDLVRTATGKVWKQMRREELKSRMIAHVHDMILFDTPEHELEHLIRMAPPLMESFNFDWINVPVKVDIKVGTAWGQLEEL